MEGSTGSATVYYLSSAPAETLPGVLARVAVAEHRVEHCLQRGKGEAGLADSQVRTWSGWHHHQALSLIAGWFLVQESRRGGEGGAGPDGAAGESRAGIVAAVGLPV
jgi:SRSO17 transposase